MKKSSIYSLCTPCIFSQNKESLNCNCSLTISENFVGISLVNVDNFSDIACFELNGFDELLTIGITCTFFSMNQSQISICFTSENNFLRFMFSLSESCCIVPNIHKSPNYYTILKNNLFIPKGNYSFISNRHEDYFYYLITQTFFQKKERLKPSEMEINFCDSIMLCYYKRYFCSLNAYLEQYPQYDYSKIPINTHNILNWFRANLKTGDSRYSKLLHHYSKIKVPSDTKAIFSELSENLTMKPEVLELSINMCKSYYAEKSKFTKSYFTISSKVALLINGISSIDNDTSKIPKWFRTLDERNRNELAYSIFSKIVHEFKKFESMKNPIQSVNKLLFQFFEAVLPEFAVWLNLHNINEVVISEEDYLFVFSDNFNEIWLVWFWILSKDYSENAIIAFVAAKIFSAFPKYRNCFENNNSVDLRTNFRQLLAIDNLGLRTLINFADYLFRRYNSQKDTSK